MASEKKGFAAEVERSRIVKLLKENVEAETNRDIQGALEFYAEGVYTLAPGMKLMKGLGDLEGLYNILLGSLVTMDNQVIDIQFSDTGDMAYMVSGYRMVMNGEDGPHNEVGKFLAVLTRKTGDWKIVAISYSADPHQ